MSYHLPLLLIVALVAVAAAQRGQPGQEIPPFLVGAPSQVVREFFSILNSDASKTESQTEADIEAFIRRLGGTYQVRFEQFKQELERARAQYEQIHRAAVQKFSPQAREADAKMSAIADSKTLTNRQKTEQIQAIMDSLSEAVRKEILDGLSQK